MSLRQNLKICYANVRRNVLEYGLYIKAHYKSWLKVLLIYIYVHCTLFNLLRMTGICVIAIGLYMVSAFYDLPDVKRLSYYEMPVPTIVYDAKKVKIAEVFTQRRYPMPLSAISPWLVKGFIAAEDHKFYQHHGLVWSSVGRAILHVFTPWEGLQGGSTITQQLAKTLLLSPERTARRKIRDMILASRIEKAYSKQKILEMYLNAIYLGNGAYGVEAAARNYLHKSSQNLSIAEAALIAGLAPAPSAYDPTTHWEKARVRQRYVLNNMLELGMITHAQMANALKTKIKVFVSKPPSNNVAPYFVDALSSVLKEAFDVQDLRQDGLVLTTTLDSRVQNIVNTAMKNFSQKNFKHDPLLQAAVVVLDGSKGAVLAMAGGIDFAKSSFDRAIFAQRQVGSCVKPLYYAYGFDHGISPSTILKQPFIKGSWHPANADKINKSQESVLEAFITSTNLQSIALYQQLGSRNIEEVMPRYGFNWPKNDLSVALGSGSSSLLNLTRAYTVFVNDGILLPAYGLTRVVDRNKNVLYDKEHDGLWSWAPHEVRPQQSDTNDEQPKPEALMSPQAAYVTRALLRDVVLYGTGHGANWIKFPVAGKTGTTNDNADAWFIGLVPPHYVVGVWVGHDDPKISLGKKGTGATIAVPVWAQIANAIAQLYGGQAWPPAPDGLVPLIFRLKTWDYLGTWQQWTQQPEQNETSQDVPSLESLDAPDRESLPDSNASDSQQADLKTLFDENPLSLQDNVLLVPAVMGTEPLSVDTPVAQ